MNPSPTPKLTGSRLPVWLAMGHFILRAPARLERMSLPAFLSRVAAEPRYGMSFAEVERLRRRWLRLPWLRSANTCYLNSLVIFRFVDPNGGDLSLHFGVDEPRGDERLHGHAWVCLDGEPLNPPPSLAEGRLKEIFRYSLLTGASSADGATFAAAMIRAGDEVLVPSPPSPV